jgi:hypothetical protein
MRKHPVRYPGEFAPGCEPDPTYAAMNNLSRDERKKLREDQIAYTQIRHE